MSGGNISNNTSDSQGGGVSLNSNSSFIMNNGIISGNTAGGQGGGIRVSSESSFSMNDGTISGNTSKHTGGGLSVAGSLIKTGGTIYGYMEGDSNSNTVIDESDLVVDNAGHAVYAGTFPLLKRKETTAGPTDELRYTNSTTWSGAWDY